MIINWVLSYIWALGGQIEIDSNEWSSAFFCVYNMHSFEHLLNEWSFVQYGNNNIILVPRNALCTEMVHLFCPVASFYSISKWSDSILKVRRLTKMCMHDADTFIHFNICIYSSIESAGNSKCSEWMILVIWYDSACRLRTMRGTPTFSYEIHM